MNRNYFYYDRVCQVLQEFSSPQERLDLLSVTPDSLFSGFCGKVSDTRPYFFLSKVDGIPFVWCFRVMFSGPFIFLYSNYRHFRIPLSDVEASTACSFDDSGEASISDVRFFYNSFLID